MNSRGVSITSLLIAMALGVATLAAVAAMFQNLFEMRTDVELQHEAESLVHFLQDRLNDPAICAQALQNSARQPITWADTTKALTGADLQYIQYGPGTSAYMTYPQPVDNLGHLQINSFTLRLPDDPKLHEGTPTFSQVQQLDVATGTTQPITYVNAKLAFSFSAPNSALYKSRPLPDRVLDIVVGLNSSGQLTGCNPVLRNPLRSESCANDPRFPASCTITPPGCEQLRFIQGFDAGGNPVCGCNIICPKPPMGPPGTYTPPPPSVNGGAQCAGGGGRCGNPENHAPIGAPGSTGDDGSGGDGGGDGGDGGDR